MSVRPNSPTDGQQNGREDVYRALVVDSGPIIRLTGLSSLRDKAKQYFTVPAVLKEIRDAKARDHLENLPFELIPREASPEGIQAVVDFARQTGDYRSLSAVDLQVLGLLWDLEREGCNGDMHHVRKVPKRTVGVGKIQTMRTVEDSKTVGARERPEAEEASEDDIDEYTEPSFFDPESAPVEAMAGETPSQPRESPSSWAMRVNASAASEVSVDRVAAVSTQPNEVNPAPSSCFGAMILSQRAHDPEETLKGQFNDADEDDLEPCGSQASDDEGYADNNDEISDEECDVYILDPDEVEERKRAVQTETTEAELNSEFPSLMASLHVPCDDFDDEERDAAHIVGIAGMTKEEAEAKRKEALRPVTKSGKLYNSFRKYRDIMNAEPAVRQKVDVNSGESSVPTEETVARAGVDTIYETDAWNEGQSRIIGGTTMSGQGTEVEDDGEGWVTCTRDIRRMKAGGKIEPTQDAGQTVKTPNEELGPPIEKRTACTTTDFAMQNIILQMNLELISVDGIQIKRLKSWVTRCGSCYTVYADGNDSGPFNTKRMFCGRCGSDYLQRIAASVDGKTGRLRLHLSRKHKTNLRGTKFSLPKPGSGNRFQGDLLLREDQLLMGAWNQKVKQRSGGKSRRAAESIFGSDLASNVGCNAKLIKDGDLNVGFGRRNPNASKHGRERRGKKKKSSDKACGLRRY